MAWHYTTGVRAAEILHEGLIKPAPAFADAPEGTLKAVWFSLRQHWEPIANEEVRGADGSRNRLPFEETVARGQGAWRFGLPASELRPWRELQSSAALSRDDARGLERSGRKVGSDPALWLASLEPVRIDRCVIQHLHGDHWCGADHEE